MLILPLARHKNWFSKRGIRGPVIILKMLRCTCKRFRSRQRVSHPHDHSGASLRKNTCQKTFKAVHCGRLQPTQKNSKSAPNKRPCGKINTKASVVEPQCVCSRLFPLQYRWWLPAHSFPFPLPLIVRDQFLHSPTTAIQPLHGLH